MSPFEFPPDAKVGMKVSIICSIQEGDQPVSFHWLKDNQLINSDDATATTTLTDANSNHYHKAQHQRFQQQLQLNKFNDWQAIKIRNSEDYSILLIDRLELKLSGNYTCLVQNEAAQSSYSSTLIINGEL